ncbi:hypothetical protein [Pseudoscardovia radai]|uniref:hypothetical protein n=1 Tax=Pseudoscardovia radai TaxID=987066 RepID=UPI0039930852
MKDDFSSRRVFWRSAGGSWRGFFAMKGQSQEWGDGRDDVRRARFAFGGGNIVDIHEPNRRATGIIHKLRERGVLLRRLSTAGDGPECRIRDSIS